MALQGAVLVVSQDVVSWYSCLSDNNYLKKIISYLKPLQEKMIFFSLIISKIQLI